MKLHSEGALRARATAPSSPPPSRSGSQQAPAAARAATPAAALHLPDTFSHYAESKIMRS